MSTCTELVHVPRTTTVYDSASPLYRFLHRRASRLKAALMRYTYRGRHHVKPGDAMETRVRDAEGNDTGERFHWVAEPSLRQKIAHVRAQRAARRDLAKAWMHTGAFPVLEDTGWIMRQRQAQRLAVYAEAMKP